MNIKSFNCFHPSFTCCPFCRNVKRIWFISSVQVRLVQYISHLERVFSLRSLCAQINDAVRSASYPFGSGELISLARETAQVTTHIYLVTRLRIPRVLPPQPS
jgi:glutaredoxin